MRSEGGRVGIEVSSFTRALAIPLPSVFELKFARNWLDFAVRSWIVAPAPVFERSRAHM